MLDKIEIFNTVYQIDSLQSKENEYSEEKTTNLAIQWINDMMEKTTCSFKIQWLKIK